MVDENAKLKRTIDDQDAKLNEIKERVRKYEKEQEKNLLQLNNDISNLKAEHDRIKDEEKSLKDEAEDVSAKKRGKISELAQILMAINNIESKCLENKATKLRHFVKDTKKPSDFDNLQERGEYAKQ